MPASYTPYRHGNRLTFKQGKAISNLGKSHNDNVIQWPAYVTQYFEIQPALIRHMHTVRNHCKSVFDNDLEYKKSIMCLALSTTAITDTLESLSTAVKFGRSVSTTLLNHQLPSITSPVTTSISQLVRQTACSDLWMWESADRGGLWWGQNAACRRTHLPSVYASGQKTLSTYACSDSQPREPRPASTIYSHRASGRAGRQLMSCKIIVDHAFRPSWSFCCELSQSRELHRLQSRLLTNSDSY